MRLISKFALSATLALGASLGLVGIKPVVADTQNCHTTVLNSASEVVRRNAFMSSETINPIFDSFKPEPNDPPSGTGGAGTR